MRKLKQAFKAVSKDILNSKLSMTIYALMMIGIGAGIFEIFQFDFLRALEFLSVSMMAFCYLGFWSMINFKERRHIKR